MSPPDLLYALGGRPKGWDREASRSEVTAGWRMYETKTTRAGNTDRTGVQVRWSDEGDAHAGEGPGWRVSYQGRISPRIPGGSWKNIPPEFDKVAPVANPQPNDGEPCACGGMPAPIDEDPLEEFLTGGALEEGEI